MCKDVASKQTVAYFRAVMTPQTKEGKLEIADEVDYLLMQREEGLYTLQS